MSLDRTLLKGGPAKVTYNGAELYARDDFFAPHEPEWAEVPTSLYGIVDHARVDQQFRIGLRLWGAWENLTVLFPSAILTPVIGTRLGASGTDLPLVIHAKNTDRITYHNAYLTRLANLYLGVDSEIFAADVEFTACLAQNKNPEDASSYLTLDTAAYSDSFSKTNYKQQRYTGAWGSKTGFTSFQAKEGVNIEWEMRIEQDKTSNLGTVDYMLMDFNARCRCIPIEPTMQNIVDASRMQGQPLGNLLSAHVDDLVWTGSGVSVTLYRCAMRGHRFAFGQRPLRNGEVEWMTTVAGAGARAAVA